MRKSIIQRAGWALALATSALVLGVLPGPARPAAAQAAIPENGIVCANSTPSVTLTATDGYISLPDGNSVYMWGYTNGGASAFQHPGPVLCVNQNDTVTVVLNNTLPEPVSIIFPGQENVLANGAPAQPQFSSGTMTSLTNAAAPNGSVTYSFTASQPGTYLYESGTQPGKQVQMGLFGALVVRPAGHASWAYGRADTEFTPGEEFMALLSEIDPNMHQAIERGVAFDMNTYVPRYFMINGRSFPDTIAPNNASWLPDQPYGALARIHPYDPGANPHPALVRYLNAGSQLYPFHPHGNNSRIVARDGRVLEAGAGGQDRSFEKFSIPVGPGQTWDSLFSWRDAEDWDATTNPIPVTMPQQQNLALGQYFSGTPYLGNQGALPPGSENYNQCGEYYHVAHNHALQAITAWGITMSGQITYTRIDPPLPNSCP